jgi:hypothetical protein
MIGRPRRPLAAPPALGLLLVGGIAAACGAGPAGSPDASSTATAAPTVTPTVTAAPAPGPVAEILTESGALPGSLGTYTLDGRGSDAPWLPFDGLPAVDAAAGGTLTVRFMDGVAIGDWSVLLAAAEDTTGAVTRGLDGVGQEPGGRAVTIGPLPPGRWVLMARLVRADGRGDGLTYWAITVR